LKKILFNFSGNAIKKILFLKIGGKFTTIYVQKEKNSRGYSHFSPIFKLFLTNL